MLRNPDRWTEYTPTVPTNQITVAPAAGATVADLGELPAGIWQVTAFGSYGGTPDVIDNMALMIADRRIMILPVVPVANASPIPITLPAVTILPNQDLHIIAIAAGAVGSVYRATLIATPVQSLDPT